jgi:uncharacterized glyoxalase superfamily protein PhnB
MDGTALWRSADKNTKPWCYRLAMLNFNRLHYVNRLINLGARDPKVITIRMQRMCMKMNQSILHVALVVRDYDEAIEFFCQKLRFKLLEDTYQPEQDKRWIVVAPPGSFLFLRTDDFWRDYNEMVSTGIKFVRQPKKEPYGTVAVFEDLYGNLWDLIELT